MRFLPFSLLEFTLYTIVDGRSALLLREKYISTCIYCALNLDYKFNYFFYIYCRVVTRVQPDGQTDFNRPQGFECTENSWVFYRGAVVQISKEYRLSGSETDCCG